MGPLRGWGHFFGSPSAPRAFRQGLAGSLRSHALMSPGHFSIAKSLVPSTIDLVEFPSDISYPRKP
ncbi:hypothetical protein PRIPAC_97810 [Pristionchus pacificus]|uniref:Uncharacterized protein n=1 Tax=Pristionchus pacificus TaxID=54126 RepID=A0A2A6BJV9_PRIPA|nr:hypothetical protein PRIPAC_97810 [Pristionchus pacificus]|eukprot:PDM66204.1 hypothetical protein PRIPAC_45429 [Pristionchus pacificus]